MKLFKRMVKMFLDCINYDNTLKAERTSPTDIDMYKGNQKIAHIHCEAKADTEAIRKDFERIKGEVS